MRFAFTKMGKTMGRVRVKVEAKRKVDAFEWRCPVTKYTSLEFWVDIATQKYL